MRGSHVKSKAHHSWLGIIPAGAGLTSIDVSDKTTGGDHPRGCGAHLRLRSFARILKGSSPRVRGSRAWSDALAALVGIIPAGAGLTAGVAIANMIARDHPRGCGAHSAAMK